MDEILLDAIACITIEGTDVRGTGFLVSSDLVATALHVVVEQGPLTFFKGTISLSFPGHKTEADVVKNAWDPTADCVLLRCRKPPPLDYRPLPLRELDRSDDEWKTFGFPDAQPIDGLVMKGEVSNHAATLMRYPAIQLYCVQCAAGRGAPVKGLSGAPVILGNVAVGLMRFALLDKDDASTAGTLYACKAQDLIKLSPDLKLRPPLVVATVMTTQQQRQLQNLLLAAFEHGLADLMKVSKYSLGLVLDLGPDDQVDSVVGKLMKFSEQRGQGLIEMLLRGSLAARPDDEGLKKFCETNFANTLKPLDPTGLVQKAAGALIGLTKIGTDGKVHDVLESYRNDFEATRKQIDKLSRYKEIHNCLHQLQFKLSAIKSAIDRNPFDNDTILNLASYASDLADLARSASDQAAGLGPQDKSDQQELITEFDSATNDMVDAAQPLDKEAVHKKMLAIYARLLRLLKFAPDVNRKLVETARFVRLDGCAETMNLITKRLDQLTQDELLIAKFVGGSVSVEMLRSRLDGLVAEHDEWQWLNTELETAMTSASYQPQMKFLRWISFSDRLAGLCNINRNEKVLSKVRPIIEAWIAKPPPEPTDQNVIDRYNYNFWSFRDLCLKRFVKVDDDLNDLCDLIVTNLKTPLDTLIAEAD
jgi:Trypsin-like peptidase domain